MQKGVRIVLYCLIMLAIAIGCVSMGFYLLKSPEPKPESAPAEEFSSVRAIKFLENIAKAPHPIGSEEHNKVRDYITDTIKELGFNPQVGTEGMLSNIIVRIEGSNPKRDAVMLTAHYDSVGTAPGAGDDGAAVAALLETLRALKNTRQLKNDVIVLISDGEEPGLLGAKLFIKSYPVKDIKMIFNFEARGCSGYSLMYDTGKNNYTLMKEFIKAAPYPIAFSSSRDYPRSGYNDLDEYKRNGLQGMVFAFNKGYFAYHSNHDNLENISLESIQHHGSNMLSLAKHFGNIELDSISDSENGVFFNIFRSKVVVYPESWVLPLAIMIAILSVAAICLGFRKRLISLIGLVKGLLCFIISLLAAFLLGSAGLKYLKMLMGDKLTSMLRYDSYTAPYLIGFLLAAIVVVLILFILMRKDCKPIELYSAALMVWIVVMLYTGLSCKGTSYMFTWPAAFAGLGLLLTILITQRQISGIVTIIPYAVVCIPSAIIFTPSIYMYFIDATLTQVAIYMTMLTLVIGLLIPLVVIPISTVMPVCGRNEKSALKVEIGHENKS